MADITKQNMEYSVNEHVVYRRDGICKITDIRDEDLGGMGVKTYYILNPIYSPNTVLYVPADSEELTSRMKKILSKIEIDKLIELSGEYDDSWIDDNNERYKFFKNILNNGSRMDILRVLKQLALHKEEVAKTNRKFYTNDEKFLTDAERIITDEFAFVLGIEKEDVIPYITGICERCGS